MNEDIRFRGLVSFYESAYMVPNGKHYFGVYGDIRVLPADATGMKPARGDTPWLLEVSSVEGDAVMYIPGCKVGVVTKYEGELSGEIYVV